jgi:hypothetical protein
VRSDSFAMHSSTNYLASSGLTFEIMCFGLNTDQTFNRHLPKAQQPEGPLEQMDNPWSRREPEPPSRATPEALYSGTASGCTFSPRIRTGITSGPNLQIPSLAFTRNSLLKKVSPEPAHKLGNTVRTAVHREWCVLHSRAICIARHPQLYICTDAGCIAVRVDPSGCIFVRKGSPHLYSCTN